MILSVRFESSLVIFTLPGSCHRTACCGRVIPVCPAFRRLSVQSAMLTLMLSGPTWTDSGRCDGSGTSVQGQVQERNKCHISNATGLETPQALLVCFVVVQRAIGAMVTHKTTERFLHAGTFKGACRIGCGDRNSSSEGTQRDGDWDKTDINPNYQTMYSFA